MQFFPPDPFSISCGPKVPAGPQQEQRYYKICKTEYPGDIRILTGTHHPGATARTPVSGYGANFDGNVSAIVNSSTNSILFIVAQVGYCLSFQN